MESSIGFKLFPVSVSEYSKNILFGYNIFFVRSKKLNNFTNVKGEKNERSNKIY
jgi:hypothetical protein